MNTAEAIKQMKAGHKVRGKTWWHGRYVRLLRGDLFVCEDGEPAQMDRLGDNWEIYVEAPRLEKFGCAVYTNGRGTYYCAPIMPNEIDHISWKETEDPDLIKAAKEVL